MKNSIRAITKQYNELIEKVKTDKFYTDVDLTNRVNCYNCTHCHHTTKSKDIDSGVTPFMFTCEKCGRPAYSTFYNDTAPTQEPTWEWFRPTLKQCLRMRIHNTALLDHVLSGGLDFRRIKKVRTASPEEYYKNCKLKCEGYPNTDCPCSHALNALE